MHLLFVQMLNEQVVQKKDSQYRATLEQERAEALMESYTTQRRLTHEFANHLEALSLMLQQNDVAGARGYLTSISKTIQMNSAILNTHNPLLDALLSKKYEEAARKGVMMYFDLSDLKDIPLDRTHLVIVVSNLLNNAIEAAAQAAPPEVYVRMKKTEGELVISVRNRVRQNVEIPEGQLPVPPSVNLATAWGWPMSVRCWRRTTPSTPSAAGTTGSALPARSRPTEYDILRCRI